MSDIRKSIGIFYKQGDAHGTENALEVHINLWSIKGNKSPFYALDFGLMLPKQMKDVLILLPFKANISEKSDIGEKLANDRELLCSVFHEDYKKEDAGDNVYAIKGNNEVKFYIYKLTYKTSLTVKQNDAKQEYTEIHIKQQYQETDIQNVDKIYVRFQIILNDLNPFARNTQISNDFFQSAFSSSHLFDFRINDLREIDNSVKETIMHNGYIGVMLSKVHFFYMSEISETVDYANNLYVDTRMLEQKIWNKYFEDSKVLKGDNLAYHWKQLKKIGKQKIVTSEQGNEQYIEKVFDIEPQESFSLFFKTTYLNFSWKRLTSYSFFVFLLGVIASNVIGMVSLIGNPLTAFLPLTICLGVSLFILILIICNLK